MFRKKEKNPINFFKTLANTNASVPVKESPVIKIIQHKGNEKIEVK